MYLIVPFADTDIGRNHPELEELDFYSDNFSAADFEAFLTFLIPR